MANYLDENGLLYLWQKIKTALAGKADTGHTHNYAGSSSAGGSANSAVKLDASAGSETQPVYFSNGVPVKTTHTLGKSVPADAVFTDTTYGNASASAAGLMSASDYSKLAAFGAASTYALKSDVTSAVSGMYKYKGSKSPVADLPSSGNTTGDVWNVSATGMNYAWNGTEWDSLGETFTITAITNTQIDTIVAS